MFLLMMTNHCIVFCDDNSVLQYSKVSSRLFMDSSLTGYIPTVFSSLPNGEGVIQNIPVILLR